MNAGRGLAGRLAAAFVANRLTPLLAGIILLLGLGALVTTPREEEPQISVPMVDLWLADPGATPAEVEQRLATPVERALWEIPGVEYVYSTSMRNGAMLIVRFKVGEDGDRAIQRVHAKLAALRGELPPGLPEPSVKLRTIDDVPILALTLWSDTRGAGELAQLADALRQRLGDTPGLGATRILGAGRREITVEPDLARLAGRGLPLDALVGALAGAGERARPGDALGAGRDTPLWLDAPLRSAADVRDTVIAAPRGRPVRVGEVAAVRDGDGEPAALVFHGRERAERGGATGLYPAVTLTFAKRPGVNATELSHTLRTRVAALRPTQLPADVRVETVRDYGETSAEKSGELIKHLWLATLSVVVLIAFALGWREAGVVAIAIPVTLALTLLIYRVTGYTLNRVTLFALIFAIGILVDDAIVVVENIARHLSLGGGAGLRERIVAAVDEVGSPTILATWAVIAAILPLAFVGGLMGPYMRPIPVGASLAMLFSLAVAFILTPWAAARLLRPAPAGAHHGGEGRLDRLYRGVMSRLLDRPRERGWMLAGVVLLLLLAVALVPLKAVKVKMLPFDNKNELELVVNMPEGTPLEATVAAAQALARAAAGMDEVVDYQIYAGVGAPVTFNGLVRHYDQRSGGAVAEVQLNLKPRHERKLQSHPFSAALRERLLPVAKAHGVRLQVVEVPPGPPVLATLVAEVYGPDYAGQVELAGRVREVFQATPGVVDVDWYMEAPREQRRFTVLRDRAALSGVAPGALARTLQIAAGGADVAAIRPEGGPPVPVRVRLAPALRANTGAFGALPVAGATGTVSLGELVREESAPVETPIYHKNLRPVVYVTGEVSGAEESPVYAIGRLSEKLRALKAADGASLALSTVHPPGDGVWGVKWDGEWQVTYEVFRDMGIAFAAVMVLIFALIVGWFGSYKTPWVIMAPIPLTLVGILPAHWMTGAFFTATSMIGFIVGAGIIVRNSIILVDFVELRRSEGLSLRDAVIDAGAVRFRPMLLTAAAVVAGSFVILFDPIFQGLAVSLMAGEVASTLLSRFTIPVLYYLAHREEPAAPAAARPVIPEPVSPSESDPPSQGVSP